MWNSIAEKMNAWKIIMSEDDLPEVGKPVLALVEEDTVHDEGADLVELVLKGTSPEYGWAWEVVEESELLPQFYTVVAYRYLAE